MGKVLAAIVVVVTAVYAIVPWHWWMESKVSLQATLAPPGAEYWFGADNLGRDLFLRLSQVIRVSVLPLWGTVILFSVLGCSAGVGVSLLPDSRWFSALKLFLRSGAVVVGAVPVGVAAFVWAVFSERAGLQAVAIAIGALMAVRCFLHILDLMQQDQRLGYWQAHAALGGSKARLIWRYGLASQWRRPLLTALAFHLQVAVAIEASISYLGFGVQEPTPSFGNMLASHFDLFLKGQWQVLVPILLVFAATAAWPTLLHSVLTAPTARGLGWRNSQKHSNQGALSAGYVA